MVFDQKTRNLLQRTVTVCRRVLDREFTGQLQELYGIQPDGSLTPCGALEHLADEGLEVARLLRERLNHLEGGAAEDSLTRTQAKPEHIARVIREQAFTALNRLAALRLCEERGLLLECVRQGVNSEGFQLFLSSTGYALGETQEAYRVYLHCLFDELAIDLGVLFDRFSSLALLFPRHDALSTVLNELNGSGKAAERDDLTAEQFVSIWQADETIGWIYQYYNDDAERKKMREESAAPRNSRELAVRNQFFTPRYVVEFLTDNTLGRLWREMTRGGTALATQCRYLIHATGMAAPSGDPERPLKDPRTIRLLDPACGSMHFGLYAFDLFETIYDEAWALEETLGPDALSRPPVMRPLQATYACKDAFRADVPRLIIEHNLHGIDIDPRCAQIACLSLWLRAQKTWQHMGFAPAQGPRITRSNIVCAEPMPGDKAFLSEFIERGFPSTERAVFLRFLEGVCDQMTLAGEAGSLLKIEEEVRSAVAEAKQLWSDGTPIEPAKLFTELEPARQRALHFEPSGLSDDEFWETAESRIYAALREYAERVESVGGFQRRLFAEDSARGFAFVDLCRQRYDVVLMNPPFGDASLPSKPYIEDTYGDTKGDVYKAFVECFHSRLVPTGYLGIISSRTGFFLSQSEDWRTRVVRRLFRPIALADLGTGVLDAMVEVAAYVLRSLSASEARDLTLSIVPVLEKVVRDRQDRFSLPKWQIARDGLKRHQAVAELEHLEAHGFVQRIPGHIVRYTPVWHSVREVTAPPEPAFPPFVCVGALEELDKGTFLKAAIAMPSHTRKFVCDPADFAAVSGHTFAYWVSKRVLARFQELPWLETGPRIARQGGVNGDDFRHLRLWWECPGGTDSHSDWRWTPFAKGGMFSRFYLDLHLQILWDAVRETFASFTGLPHRPTQKPASCENYFRPGITWSRRSQRGLSLRALPEGCVFADKGPSAFIEGDEPLALAALLAVTNSSPFRGLVALQMAFGSYEVGVIQRTPVPKLVDSDVQSLARLATQAWGEKRSLDSAQSASHAFLLPAMLAQPSGRLAERAAAWAGRARTSVATVAVIQAEIDDIAFRLYDLDGADRGAMTTTLSTEATGDAGAEAGDDEEEETADGPASALVGDLLAYALGCAFGRWDIRYATGERPGAEAPDPFDPLPDCPPGMLQDSAGLPAAPGDVPVSYPARITWPGIIVDDQTHAEDIERRVGEVLAVIFSDRTDAIVNEACSLLRVTSLREWFRRPAGFFTDHLKSYSKSRRQAPIYWPLSTASGSYTLWIYYHRLTPDTLYRCIQQFVNPKLNEVEQELGRLHTVLTTNEGGARERKRFEELEGLRRELIELRAELELWAPKWKPNLNDGVLITAAPLWRLFRLPKWQKDLKACWQALERGDYLWAHLAYALWPDRVREKCRTDRSIAIAHRLEDLYETKPLVKKAKKRKPGVAAALRPEAAE